MPNLIDTPFLLRVPTVDYATRDVDNYGGFRVVPLIANLTDSTIKAVQRVQDMKVRVQQDHNDYVLQADLTTWVISSGGGLGGLTLAAPPADGFKYRPVYHGSGTAAQWQRFETARATFTGSDTATASWTDWGGAISMKVLPQVALITDAGGAVVWMESQTTSGCVLRASAPITGIVDVAIEEVIS